MHIDGFRLFIALVFGALLAIKLYSGEGKERKYLPILDPTLLLSYFVAALILTPFFGLMFSNFGGVKTTARILFLEMVRVLLHTSLYFALLLCLMPLLRRFVSARTCAALWLVPNVLYLVFNSNMIPGSPSVLLPLFVKGNRLLILWPIGAVVILAWRVAQHLSFRRALLADAVPAEGTVLELWQQAQREMKREKTDIPLLCSPRTATPLSIGLLDSTLRVVLPEQTYSEDELRLIFRHELIHISRRDAQTKLFLTVCTAVLWWNPLMWLAKRRCAEDLELGCDEFALLDEPEGQRRRYAQLLLRTAGDERGFTTCLSASARALQYRMENVLHPRRRLLGGVLLGAACTVLMLSYGMVSIAGAPQTLAQAVSPDGAVVEQVDALNWHGAEEDELARRLWSQISDAEIYETAGAYRLPLDERTLAFTCKRGEQFVRIGIWDRYLKLETYPGTNVLRYYAFAETPDWDALYAELSAGTQ
ncbi:MAG: M56 family metallopeptidase [Oscillospiraceae bacterium]|nr:M56 family metallopeptidase [Oscillospiraceae bacterium]